MQEEHNVPKNIVSLESTNLKLTICKLQLTTRTSPIHPVNESLEGSVDLGTSFQVVQIKTASAPKKKEKISIESKTSKLRRKYIQFGTFRPDIVD